MSWKKAIGWIILGFIPINIIRISVVYSENPLFIEPHFTWLFLTIILWFIAYLKWSEN